MQPADLIAHLVIGHPLRVVKEKVASKQDSQLIDNLLSLHLWLGERLNSNQDYKNEHREEEICEHLQTSSLRQEHNHSHQHVAPQEEESVVLDCKSQPRLLTFKEDCILIFTVRNAILYRIVVFYACIA